MMYAVRTAAQPFFPVFDESSRVEALVEVLQRRLGAPPDVCLVLGSGWRQALDAYLEPVELGVVDLAQIDNWPHPQVPGHEGRVRLLEVDGRRVATAGGRVHAYEGYSAAEICRGVRAMVHWGAAGVVLTNAAGGLDASRPVGEVMPLEDHINWGLPNPLTRGQNCGLGAQFLDVVDLYDPEWRAGLLERRPELKPGVYVGVAGPTYETPAEVRMLAGLGADAVGMSTIPEAIAARALGAKVLGLSLISNPAAGVGGSRPDHEEVVEAGRAHAAAMGAVLAAAIEASPGVA